MDRSRNSCIDCGLQHVIYLTAIKELQRLRSCISCSRIGCLCVGENSPTDTMSISWHIWIKVQNSPVPPLQELLTLLPFDGILNSLEVVHDGLIEELEVTAVVLQTPVFGIAQGKCKLPSIINISSRTPDWSYLRSRICNCMRSHFQHT